MRVENGKGDDVQVHAGVGGDSNVNESGVRGRFFVSTRFLTRHTILFLPRFSINSRHYNYKWLGPYVHAGPGLNS